MSSYGWLSERKKQAELEASQKGKRQISFAGNTIGSRFMGFTGNGEDNKFQKNMPVAMMQTTQGPAMIHEGEGMMQNSDGSMTVVPQKDLARIQKVAGTRGFAEGGTYEPQITPKPEMKTNYNQTTQLTPISFNDLKPAGTTSSTSPNTVTQPKPITAQESALSASKSIEDQARATGLNAIADVVKGGSVATQLAGRRAINEAKGMANVGQQTLEQQGAQRGLGEDVVASRMAIGRAENSANISDLQAQQTIAQRQAQEQAASNLASQGLAGRAQIASEEQWDKTYNLNREKFKADQNWTAFDAAINSGDTETAANVYQQITGSSLDPSYIKALHDYNLQKEGQAVERAGIDINQARTDLEQDKTTFADNILWTQYDAAMNAKDYKTAASLYNQITGKTLDVNVLSQLANETVEQTKLTTEDLRQNNVLSGQSINANQQSLIDSSGTRLNSYGQLPTSRNADGTVKDWKSDPTATMYLLNHYKNLTGNTNVAADDATFKQWADGAWNVATDNTLSNTYNSLTYSINSSSLPEDIKQKFRALIYSQPDLISGIRYNQDTGLYELIPENEQASTVEEQPSNVNLLGRTGGGHVLPPITPVDINYEMARPTVTTKSPLTQTQGNPAPYTEITTLIDSTPSDTTELVSGGRLNPVIADRYSSVADWKTAYDALPVGAYFISSDGVTRQKEGGIDASNYFTGKQPANPDIVPGGRLNPIDLSAATITNSTDRTEKWKQLPVGSYFKNYNGKIMKKISDTNSALVT